MLDRIVSSYPRFIIFSCQKFRYCALSLLKIQSKLSLTGQCLKTSASKSGVAATWLAAMQTGFWVEEAHIDAICTAKKSQLRLTEYHPGARPPWSPCRHWLSSSLSIPCLLVPTSQIWGVFVVPTACLEADVPYPGTGLKGRTDGLTDGLASKHIPSYQQKHRIKILKHLSATFTY